MANKEHAPQPESFGEKAKRVAKHVGKVALIGAGLLAVL